MEHELKGLPDDAEHKEIANDYMKYLSRMDMRLDRVYMLYNILFVEHLLRLQLCSCVDYLNCYTCISQCVNCTAVVHVFLGSVYTMRQS